jgi:16S rRNA (guanine966-N2)-methyltransferase
MHWSLFIDHAELVLWKEYMRIISGILKGVHLQTLVDGTIRPTSQKVREALFNILGERVIDAHFLDVFAGIGTIGIEALSRGAGQVAFVEKDSKALRTLRRNIDGTGMASRCQILAGDIMKKSEALRGQSFDILYLDPPYNFISHREVLEALMEKGIINNGGVIVCEHYHKTLLSLPDEELEIVRREKYGQTRLTFLKLK